MVTRVVECTVKPEKRAALLEALHDEVVPILREQPGFLQLLALTPEEDEVKLLIMSLWRRREDAEEYDRTDYPRVLAMLKQYLRFIPEVKIHAVEFSTMQRMAATAAA